MKQARAKTGIHLLTLLAGGVFATAVALSAIALAEPNTDSWDLEAFDACLRKIDTTVYPGAKFLQEDAVHQAMMNCCLESGGVWSSNTNTCSAPPGQAPAPRINIPPELGNAPVATMTPQEPLPPVGATG